MKTTRYRIYTLGFALALATSSLHATTSTLPAPKPEFMNSEQLAEWRAKKTAEFEAKQAQESAATSQAEHFYTGKPYLEESGTYAFLFRQYDPELSRWTSADPSGFPDGANNHNYAVIPTSGVDFAGLWAVQYSPGVSNQPPPQQISYNGYNYTLAMQAPSAGGSKSTAIGLLQSHFGSEWQILSAGSSIGTLSINAAGTYFGSGSAGAGFDSTLVISTSPVGAYKVVQVVTTNKPIVTDGPNQYLDYSSGAPLPFYDAPNLGSGQLNFGDISMRPISWAQDSSISWSADSFLVDYDVSNKIVTVFEGGMQWGWDLWE
jgi:RHS repeat-associated protein